MGQKKLSFSIAYSGHICHRINSVQLQSHVWLLVTPWIAAHQASLSITNSWSLLNWCPLGGWCHLTISSFFSCLQSFPALGSFQMSKFFRSGGQSIGVSASALVLPKNIQDLFPLGLTGWMSLQSKVQESFPTPQFKSTNSSVLSFLYSPTLTFMHDYRKNHSLEYTDLCWQSNVSAV